MPLSHDDIVSIEKALSALAAHLNGGESSALSDLVDDTTLVMAPARQPAKGQSVPEFLRVMALNNEGVQLHSGDIQEIGEGLVRDIGTLSLRRKQQPDQRLTYRCVTIWRKAGPGWKLSTMVWNRSQAARGQRGGQ